MRLERRDDDKAELGLRPGEVHILRPEQIARLAVWIEELWPEQVADARKPALPVLYRTDEGMEGEA